MSLRNDEERCREQTPHLEFVSLLDDDKNAPSTPIADTVKEELNDTISSIGSSVIAYTPSPKKIDVVTLDSDNDEDGCGEPENPAPIVSKSEIDVETPVEEPPEPPPRDFEANAEIPAEELPNALEEETETDEEVLHELENEAGAVEEPPQPPSHALENEVEEFSQPPPRTASMLPRLEGGAQLREEAGRKPREVRRPTRPNPRYRQLSPVNSTSSHSSTASRARCDFSVFDADKRLPLPPPSQESADEEPSSQGSSPRKTPKRPRGWRPPTPAARRETPIGEASRDGTQTAVVALIRRQSPPNQDLPRRSQTPLSPLPPLPQSSQQQQLDASRDEENNLTRSAVSSQASLLPIRQQAVAPAGRKRPTPGVYIPRGQKRKKPPVKQTLTAEIKRLQKSEGFLIPKLPFSRVVRGITEVVCNDMGIESKRWQSAAIGAIQTVSEYYISHLLVDAHLCALHGHRITIKPQDIQVALRLRPGDDPGKKTPHHFDGSILGVNRSLRTCTWVIWTQFPMATRLIDRPRHFLGIDPR